MSNIFDFAAEKFFAGRQNGSAWDEFFAQSAGPKKWRKETRYSSVSAKLRVIHATKFTKDADGKRVMCKASATMTIPMKDLKETAKTFTFTVSSSGICTCLGK